VEVPTVHGKVKLKIPAGTQTGTTFRLKGKGVPNVHGYGTGDQHVIIKLITPTKMTEKQKQLMRDFAAVSGDAPDEYQSSLFDRLKRTFKGD
jgi:molecular chaperone DnaJ